MKHFNAVEKRALTLEDVPLNPDPKHAPSQEIDEAALKVYLDSFKPELPHRKMAEMLVRKYLRKITMQELLDRLAECVAKVNPLLADKPYSVMVEGGHSTEWIAELSLRQLQTLPCKVVQINDNYRCNNTDLKDCKTFVLFDDCSFSGKQLATRFIPDFFKQLALVSDKKVIEVIFVVVFMTDHAKKAVHKKVLELQRNYKNLEIKFELIQGDRILTISELPIEQSQIPCAMEVLGINSEDILKRYSLTWADWKLPDDYSFPANFANATLENQCSRYTGMLIDHLPPEVRRPKNFIPDPPKPYSEKRRGLDYRK